MNDRVNAYGFGILHKITLLCFLIFSYPLLLPAQFKARLGGESGVYFVNDGDSGFLSRLPVRISYSAASENYYMILNTRFSPEWIISGSTSSVFKFSGSVRAGQKLSSGNWQISAAYKNFSYNIEASEKLGFNAFLLDFNFQHFFNRKTNIGINLNYHLRDADYHPRVSLDGYGAVLFTTFFFPQKISVQPGIYFEKYHLEQSYAAYTTNGYNRGYRAGPQLNFSVRRGYILNVSYDFIAARSNTYSVQSFEHIIQGMWGSYLNTRTSLFFFFRYHFVDKSDAGAVPVELQYTPLDHENWLYLKLGRDLSDKAELYLKAGYSSDELPQSRQTYSYWQILPGITFTF